ncbi:MAG TPA: isoaspartyl peptidase/L-asparaginase, partial [Candidatus Acidoferrales bacterium]|nr:isoaspartyl peptidase/L-asparaginase [Candidatus Acidoferrales bacterium]
MKDWPIWTRRKFCVSALTGGIAASASSVFGAVTAKDEKNAGGEIAAAKPAQSASTNGKRLCIISAMNGLHHLDAGMQVLRTTGDTMDAVLAVVTPVEDDPNDNTVGYGGLPNEDGVVQLDACVMHGPTRKCGAVGAIEKIRNPAKVARVVMERTNHTFLAGQGATKFAIDEGFEPMNLLTDKSRLAWLAWKAQSS